jgi:hypothetical protein
MSVSNVTQQVKIDNKVHRVSTMFSSTDRGYNHVFSFTVHQGLGGDNTVHVANITNNAHPELCMNANILIQM